MEGAKKTASVTVKMESALHDFAVVRAKQCGCESPSEYIRDLLEADREKARVDLNLLAESLGIKEFKGILGTPHLLQGRSGSSE